MSECELIYLCGCEGVRVCVSVCVKVGNLQYFLSHERKDGVESSDYHVHRFH